MDKRKVIAAYRRGLISVQECAQILGLDNVELLDYMRDPRAPRPKAIKKQSVRT
jgi:predicted DNA-binding transcriptional regulator AlpA